MKNSFQVKTEQYKTRRSRKKLWQRIVTAMAAVVVFCTTYALIIPAVTWERSLICELQEHVHTDKCYSDVLMPAALELICTQEEHSHDDSCREEVRTLICTLSEGDGHTHTDDCYTQTDGLICGLEESVAHTHDAACYEQNKELLCTIPESDGHIHTADCYVQDKELICTVPESDDHIHTDECYSFSDRLACGMEETEAHTHTDECYLITDRLVCGLEESEGHIHTDECHGPVKTLICTEETEAHTHTDECYEIEYVITCSKEEHVHTDACYVPHEHTTACYDENGVLICTKGEHIERMLVCELEEHTHTDACFDAPPAEDEGYFCGVIAHTHNENCYFSDGSLRCTLPEHEHTEICKSDSTADVELRADWEKNVLKVRLTGVWADDVLAIADSQLGYRESSRNFVIDTEGRKFGYTRYGAWYGIPYGDWCAMYCAFCYDYAGVKNFPASASCQRWINMLHDEERGYDYLRDPDEYTPKPGDLVFFDYDEAIAEGTARTDRDSEHVGIVYEYVAATETEPGRLVTIEGNWDNLVQYVTRDLDEKILWYAELPENPALLEDTDSNIKYLEDQELLDDAAGLDNDIPETEQFELVGATEDGITVTLTGPVDSLPYPADEITLVVRIVEDDASSNALMEEAANASGIEEARTLVVDVALYHGEEEIEPTGWVEVRFSGIAGEEDTNSQVFHLDKEDGTANEMASEIEEDGTIVMGTNHFSQYGFVIGKETLGTSTSAAWSNNQLTAETLTVNSAVKDKTYYLVVSTDGGNDWTSLASATNSGKINNDSKDKPYNFNLTSYFDASDPADALFRIVESTDTQTKNISSYSKAVSVKDFYEAQKAGFSSWLTTNGYSVQTVGDLNQRFAQYMAIPAATISAGPYAGKTFVSIDSVSPTPAAGSTYKWQYQDASGNWIDLTSPTSSTEPINSSSYTALSGGKNVRCCILDSNNELISASNVVFVDPAATGAKADITAATWVPSGASGSVSSITASMTHTLQDPAGKLEYSDDGSSWTQISQVGKAAKPYTVTSTSTNSINADSALDREWKMTVTKDNKSTTATFDIFDILEACKSGFNDWLLGSYVQNFGGTHLPANKTELYEAFQVYYGLPVATISTQMSGDDMLINAAVDVPGAYTYAWEYQDDNGNWQTLTESTGGTGSNGQINASLCTPLGDGGRNVRCKVYDSSNRILTVSNTLFVNPLRELYDQAIAAINTGLNLSSYPIMVGGYSAKGNTATKSNFDVSIHGTNYDNYFYWTNLANDPDVPFTDGDTFADYLAKLYLSEDDPDEGLAKAKKAFDKYIYDMFDPSSVSWMTNITKYPTYTYGDQYPDFVKDTNSSSFHSTMDVKPKVNQLNYDFLEEGVDYSNFISDPEKSATAVAAGDSNTERKYLIDITADAQARATAPVALILQIQTSWQLFDLMHANAQSGEGKTEVGSASYNTELANLYDIKQALLRFVEYMRTQYPGNNLVLGITETRHDASQTMFYGTDDSGNKLYVTNDYNTLIKAIESWDTFGNCEHVHYDTKTLEAAASNLSSNLSGWQDVYGNDIEYDDIQKVAVIIGGPTENSNSTNGYACTLPWGTFVSSGIDSVYGIRVNRGSPVTAGVPISWLDYSGNNGDNVYDRTDSNSNAFTRKYVASTEDAVFMTLVNIAESEMTKKGLDIQAQDKYVDDVIVTDTVTDEFIIDPTVPFTATIYNSDKYGAAIEQGKISYQTVINWQDGTVTQTEYTAGIPGASVTVPATFTVTTEADGSKKTVISFTTQQDVDYTETIGGVTEQKTLTDDIPQSLTIIENIDGTTDVTYDFGRVFNTKKCNLNFGIVARDGYIGSNNVYTNEGTPELSYTHYKLDDAGELTGEKDVYGRDCDDTPQVNVPIRFSTTDGGEKIVEVNTTVSLTDPDLNSHIIVDAFEKLVDDFDQINGTVAYTWVLPDGNEVELGSVAVKNGVPQGSFPSLDYNYLVAMPGIQTPVLEARFIPEFIDPSNPNFKQDGKTNVAVNQVMHDGIVTLSAYSTDATTSYYVRKHWTDPPEDGTTSITFLLSDGAGGYVKKDGSDWDFTTDQTEAQVFTISSSDALTDSPNDWQIRIEDLPTTKTVDGEIVPLSYSPVETVVPGYDSSVSYTTQLDEYEVYKSKITLNFTAKIGDGNRVKIVYTYNGVQDTIFVPKASLNETGNADGGKKYYSYTFDTDSHGDKLPANGSNAYTFGTSNVTLSIVKADGTVAGGGGNTISAFTSASASSYLYDKTNNRTVVMLINNKRSIATLTVRKTVAGVVTTQQFPFKAEITTDFGTFTPCDAIYDLLQNEVPYTLSVDGRTAYFDLKNGEFVHLQMTAGAEILVTETSHNGFHTMIRQGTVDVSDNDTAEILVPADTELEFVNTAGQLMPRTGGIGTKWFTWGGAALIAGALVYGFIVRRKRGRGNKH